jgi:hypothetical protein
LAINQRRNPKQANKDIADDEIFKAVNPERRQVPQNETLRESMNCSSQEPGVHNYDEASQESTNIINNQRSSERPKKDNTTRVPVAKELPKINVGHSLTLNRDLPVTPELIATQKALRASRQPGFPKQQVQQSQGGAYSLLKSDA